MLDFWGSETLNDWLLLTVLPTCLFVGLVQAGATLVSVVIYWWRKGMNIDYKLGLTLGAVAGGGFGILEAWLTHDTIFARGWTWNLVRMSGVEAFAPFLVQFFVVAFSTAASALAGYGLAKGKGWQAYLIVSVLHAALIYGTAVLAQSRSLSLIFVILFPLVVTGIALWLRWRKIEQQS